MQQRHLYRSKQKNVQCAPRQRCYIQALILPKKAMAIGQEKVFCIAYMRLSNGLKHCLDKIAKTEELTFEERVRSKRRKRAFQSWIFVACGLALFAKAHISSKFTNGDF